MGGKTNSINGSIATVATFILSAGANWFHINWNLHLAKRNPLHAVSNEDERLIDDYSLRSVRFLVAEINQNFDAMMKMELLICFYKHRCLFSFVEVLLSICVVWLVDNVGWCFCKIWNSHVNLLIKLCQRSFVEFTIFSFNLNEWIFLIFFSI